MKGGPISTNKDKILTLVVFRGCPNIDLAKSALKEARVKFMVVFQEELAESDMLKRYSSPSILLGNTLIYGAIVGKGASGCSTGLLSSRFIKESLQKLK